MRRKSHISRVLIVTLAVLTLSPLHAHLHHVDDVASSSAHEHVVDLHLLTDTAKHNHSDDATVLSTTPDVLIKKVDDGSLLAALLVCLLVLLRIVQPALDRLANTSFTVPRSHYHFAPPLRAPPLH